MDWLKLFTFLVAVASIGITAEVPLKKIRIHLPQKVKHIHHHKKIYITNHPTSSQYAPSYAPGSEGAAAMTSNVIVPAVQNYAPFDSIDNYGAAISKMIPLYRVRGHYGPTPSEWDEEDQYDVNNSEEPTDSFLFTGYGSGPSTPPARYLSNKAKGPKTKEAPRKNIIPKNKPKQVLIRGKPIQEEEHPVSTFHEQFYSDIHGLGTIKKIKKPQRVEKIIDGDTEHIHTYSEEHIHKVVFDDGAKITGMPDDDPISGIQVLPAPRPTQSNKNTQSLLALSSNPFTGFTHGPMETPANLEYTSYNPHEVTHDHIFHDHGEIPPDVDVTKNPLLYPPRVSYNSKGVRIGVGHIHTNLKYSNDLIKSTSTKTTPVTNYNYQETIPYDYTKDKSHYKNSNYYNEPAQHNTLNDDFRHAPYFNNKEKSSSKSGSLVPPLYFDYNRNQQTSIPTPLAVSSTIIHDYTPKAYSERATNSGGYLKYKNPLLNFKDSYMSNLEYDTDPASSNFYPIIEQNEETEPYQERKWKPKSFSKQSINFLDLDQKTGVDATDFYEGGFSSMSNKEDSFTDLNYNKKFELEPPDVVSSTQSNAKESSSAYSYYSALAIKALHEEQQQHEKEASTTPYAPIVGTKSSLPSEHYKVLNEAISTPSSHFTVEHRQKIRPLKNAKASITKHDRVESNGTNKSPSKDTRIVQASKYLYRQPDDSKSSSSKLNYGDKLN